MPSPAPHEKHDQNYFVEQDRARLRSPPDDGRNTHHSPATTDALRGIDVSSVESPAVIKIDGDEAPQKDLGNTFEGWTEVMDQKKGKPYYWNKGEGKTVWKMPVAFKEAKAKAEEALELMASDLQNLKTEMATKEAEWQEARKPWYKKIFKKSG